jgi:rhamnosyltransferase
MPPRTRQTGQPEPRPHPPEQYAAAIYVIQHKAEAAAHVRLALTDLLAIATRVIVVTNGDSLPNVQTMLAGFDRGQRATVITHDRDGAILSAYRAGLGRLLRDGPVTGHVILTGYHVFGPIRPDGWRDLPRDADFLSAYWHNAALDPRLRSRADMPDKLPYLDFALLSPALVNDPGFQKLCHDLPLFNDYWDQIERGLVPLARFLRDTGRRIAWAMPEDAMQTADPRHYEVHRLVAEGAPCLPVSVLMLDPLLHDLNGIDLRAALDGLRARNPSLYNAVMAFAAARVPLRAFTTIADQYEVLSTHYPSDRGTWDFGPVAVFIHAFYAEMMPEFWALIAKFPMPAHLFLSTASDQDKAMIEAFLDAQQWPAAHRTVRVVAQNRGRDMSALFITFRDVALSGDYQVALRLHSKRTPQVSRQVAEGFKAHLFDNLVHSPATIRQLLDRFEAEPDLGLVIPPVIHTGFGTLGHAWYSNREVVRDLSARMGLNVPLDADTPVAPYGTMFWFRIPALRVMFDWPWQWEDYNPEPHHIDGGLAHAQERLIGYAVQASGYRTLSVMTPQLAARNYARLEYKMQLFAARLASHHLLDQLAQLDRNAETFGIRLIRRLRVIYGRIIRRFPGARAYLKPVARRILPLLTPGYRL